MIINQRILHDLVRSGPYARGDHDRVGTLGCHAPNTEPINVSFTEALQRRKAIKQIVVETTYRGMRGEHVYFTVAPALRAPPMR